MTWDQLAARMTPAQRAFAVRYVEPYDEFDVLPCQVLVAGPYGVEATDARDADDAVPSGMPYLTP